MTFLQTCVGWVCRISLGCKSSGNISIEWDAANDEDFDGLDSDKDERDDDKESGA